VEKLGWMELLHISWSLGLRSKMWDWLGGQLSGLQTSMLRKRVRKRVEYLEIDDGLIKDGGGAKMMNIEERKMACVERGINVIGHSDAQVKANLEAWLKSRETVCVERLLLTRYVPSFKEE
jgi:hypothetical protein